MVKITGAYGKLKTWVKTQITTHTAIASAHHTNHESAASESASFKDVNIAVNEAYKQATNIILRIKELNIFIGIDAGKVATGDKNSFIGYQAGFSTTTGHSNSFIGYRSGYKNIDGYRNTFIGYESGYEHTTGDGNNFIGYLAGFSTTTGHSNSFIGYRSGYKNIDGYRNTFIGFKAGHENTGGYRNTFIGHEAGYYENGNRKLFIDNQARANESDGRIKALIYGVFDAATANQLLRINGILELTELKNGSTQANAGAGINEVWKTNGHATLPDNVLMIGV